TDDHLPQFVHVGPVDRAVLQCLHKIAGLQPRLVLAVHDDRLAAAHGDGVDFGLAEEIRADGVDVRALGDPVAVKHRFAAARGGDDNALVFGPHLRARHRLDLGLAPLAHFTGEAAAVLLVGAVNLDSADLADLADRLYLRAGLLAGAEQADLAGLGPRHVLG